MGLDMYLEKVDGVYNQQEMLEKYQDLEFEEIGYWRKHTDLNQYFAGVYYDKGGQKEFNTIPLVLSEKDVKELLDGLEDGFIQRNVKSSFSRTNEEDWRLTKVYFKKALEEVDFSQETLVYYCWW